MKVMRNSTMLGTNYWNSSRSREPKDTPTLERGGAMDDHTDVPLRTGPHLHFRGMVTDMGSNPGENGTSAHCRKHGFLVERRARLVAASDVVHSFSSDQPRLRVDGRLSNRNVDEGRGESGLEQLVKRVGRHADGCHPHAAAAATNSISPALTSVEPSLAASAMRSAAAWRHHDATRPRCCGPDRGRGTLYAE